MTRSPADRSHLSIGEVLSLLQDEFPDVTISKIRFLESQGLLDPERTPSGYRKFYEADIQRLRWILRQQKDHYLPLKVIKDRLDGIEDLSELDPSPAPDVAPEPAAAPTAPASGRGARRAAMNGRGRGGVAVDDRPGTALDAEAAAAGAVADPLAADTLAADALPADAPAPATGRAAGGRQRGEDARTGRRDDRARDGRARPPASAGGRRADARDGDRADGRTSTAAPAGGASVNGHGPGSHPDAIPVESVLLAGDAPLPPATPVVAASPPDGAGPATPAGAPGGPGVPDAASSRSHPSAGTVGMPQPTPAPPPTPAGDAPVLAGYADLARYADLGGAPAANVSLTIDELAEASGMTVRDLRELERFGLLESHVVGDAAYYDADSLVVARTAGGFLRHGIEARHLRSYKVAVDREAGLFEQIVLPLLKQRNPEAHRRANRIVAELVHLGEAMRGTLLRRELRDHID